MEEIWEYIEGTGHKYMISNYGNARSMRQRKMMLTATTQKSGYNYVMIEVDGKQKNCRLHRLVAMAFVPNPHGYREVNHIDGNKANNSADNLEWVTRSQNIMHTYRTLGIKRKSRPMPEEQRQKLRDWWRVHPEMRQRMSERWASNPRKEEILEKMRQGQKRYYQRLREQRNNERQAKELH